MRIAVTAVLAAACLALPASAHAAGYTYTTIANGSETRFLGGCPAINLLGQVAFTASDFDPETFEIKESMLRGSGGALTTIADEESDGLVGIVGNPSINDVGQVAFDANPDDDDREVILRGSGGPLTEIARASEARRFDSFTADVSLNSLGRVAFGAELNAGDDEGVFEGNGGAVATRYVASTSRFAGSAGQPSLTEVESVAFTEETDDGGAGVFRQDIFGRITQIASGFFSGRVSLNLAGRVAYSSFDAVYVNGALIANTDGEFSGFGFFGPSLNDRNQVAFQATLDDFFSNGVFTGPNATRDAVVRTGTVIGGRTVQSVSACREMLNAVGQVAATVTYDDGTPAVIRATPRR